jgi:hypothetical protein
MNRNLGSLSAAPIYARTTARPQSRHKEEINFADAAGLRLIEIPRAVLYRTYRDIDAAPFGPWNLNFETPGRYMPAVRAGSSQAPTLRQTSLLSQVSTRPLVRSGKPVGGNSLVPPAALNQLRSLPLRARSTQEDSDDELDLGLKAAAIVCERTAAFLAEGCAYGARRYSPPSPIVPLRRVFCRMW